MSATFPIHLSRPLRSARVLAMRAARRLADGYERHLQRQNLAELDDRMLADLGLSRAAVAAECAGSWWPVRRQPARRPPHACTETIAHASMPIEASPTTFSRTAP